jgi:uncharacterized protein DUF6597
MEYVSRVPAPPLDEFIDDIYCLTGVPRHRRMNVPPMPSAHLFINLGDPARLRDSDPSVPSAMLADGWFMGVWTRRFVVEYPAWVRLVGVHFKPWGISPFTGLPATELRARRGAGTPPSRGTRRTSVRCPPIDFLQARPPPGTTRSWAPDTAGYRGNCARKPREKRWAR